MSVWKQWGAPLRTQRSRSGVENPEGQSVGGEAGNVGTRWGPAKGVRPEEAGGEKPSAKHRYECCLDRNRAERRRLCAASELSFPSSSPRGGSLFLRTGHTLFLQVMGQCPCQAGFGGCTCSWYQDGYWGDPERECRGEQGIHTIHHQGCGCPDGILPVGWQGSHQVVLRESTCLLLFSPKLKEILMKTAVGKECWQGQVG